MRGTKLIELLKAFSREELRSFRKYLDSPFLKPGRDVVDLYEYLTCYSPDYTSDDLDKTIVFRNLFTDKAYNERILANQIFDLTKAAEKFLAYNSLLNNDPEFYLSLSKAYMDKNLPWHSQRVNKALEKILIRGFSVRKDYIAKFRRLTQLNNAYYTEYNDTANLIKSKTDYFNASAVQFVMDYIDILGSREPAKNNCDKDLNSPIIGAVEDCFDVDKFAELVKDDESQQPYVKILYYLLKILKEPEETRYYFEFRKFFFDYISLEDQILDREEKNTVFNYLINYCTQHYNMDFMAESLEVYKKMLEHEAYSESESDSMQIHIYRNILKVCVSLKETEWFEYFIDNYADKLSKEYKDDMTNLSYSHLHFLRKDFDAALESINNISESFELSKTDVRNLKLKIFYELEYTESAFALVNSYKQFLAHTTEIAPDNKKIFGNFVRFTNKLLKIKAEQSKESPGMLRSKIEKEAKLINKQWLLEKADELKE